MSEPQFQSADGLAATILIAELIEELMDNGRMGSAGRKRILDNAMMHLDSIDTDLSSRAGNLIIDVFGLEKRMRRS